MDVKTLIGKLLKCDMDREVIDCRLQYSESAVGKTMTKCINIKEEMEARKLLPELIKKACTNCICSMEQIIEKVQPKVPHLKLTPDEIGVAWCDLDEYDSDRLSTRLKGIVVLDNKDEFSLGNSHIYTYISGWKKPLIKKLFKPTQEYSTVVLHDLIQTTYATGYTYIESDQLSSFRRLLIAKAKELLSKTEQVKLTDALSLDCKHLLDCVGFVVNDNLYMYDGITRYSTDNKFKVVELKK